jgi:CubicO group peptidase (beta-lactamase class C family)
MKTTGVARALLLPLLILAPLVGPPPFATAEVTKAAGEPPLDETKLAAIPERLREFVDRGEISGAVTLVATREGVPHVGAVGRADIAADKPMRDDAVFWIASMTKPITATAVLMLQDEGKLSVEDLVSRYVPELGAIKTAGGEPANLTLRHLLTHTSGMGEATREQERNAKTLADLIPAYAKQPIKFTPGTRWQYSQSGINSLARVVEVVSGQSFPEFLDKRLFGPLGMKDTTFYPGSDQLARLAKSYKCKGGTPEEAPIFIFAGRDVASRDRVPLANGGLFSTASDYARLCRMILNDGTLDGKRYLKPESVKLMTALQTADVPTGFTPGNGWGLGWCVVRKPQGPSEALSPGSFGHGGAYGTQAWIDPKRGLAFILMVQRSDFPNADAADVRKAFQEAAVAALREKH